MRFLRSNQLAPPDPESTIVDSPPRPLREELLFDQLDLLVALNGALLARAERAEALLAAAAEQNRDLHPLLGRLGVLAGERLPEIAAQTGALRDANIDLHRDVGLLTNALIGADIAEFESGNDQNNE
jgi:hypothetical protein